MYAICQRNKAHLDEVGDKFGIAVRYTDFAELLADPNVDAVHINSPIDDHAWMSIDALKAGKHVASTVPMARTVEECRQVVEAQKQSGKKYTMMETTVFTREYLFVKELVEKGELGRIQFVRAAHHQEMAAGNWPNYWPGMPPMHYATHCVGPCLASPASAPNGSRASAPAAWMTSTRGTMARPSPSRRPTSSSRTRTCMPRSRARSTTRRASTSRASTCTAARPASSGSRSRPKSR